MYGIPQDNIESVILSITPFASKNNTGKQCIESCYETMVRRLARFQVATWDKKTVPM